MEGLRKTATRSVFTDLIHKKNQSRHDGENSREYMVSSFQDNTKERHDVSQEEKKNDEIPSCDDSSLESLENMSENEDYAIDEENIDQSISLSREQIVREAWHDAMFLFVQMTVTKDPVSLLLEYYQAKKVQDCAAIFSESSYRLDRKKPPFYSFEFCCPLTSRRVATSIPLPLFPEVHDYLSNDEQNKLQDAMKSFFGKNLEWAITSSDDFNISLGQVFFSHKKAAKKCCALAALLQLDKDFGAFSISSLKGSSSCLFVSSRAMLLSAFDTKEPMLLNEVSRNDNVIDLETMSENPNSEVASEENSQFQLGQKRFPKWVDTLFDAGVADVEVLYFEHFAEEKTADEFENYDPNTCCYEGFKPTLVCCELSIKHPINHKSTSSPKQSKRDAILHAAQLLVNEIDRQKEQLPSLIQKIESSKPSDCGRIVIWKRKLLDYNSCLTKFFYPPPAWTVKHFDDSEIDVYEDSNRLKKNVDTKCLCLYELIIEDNEGRGFACRSLNFSPSQMTRIGILFPQDIDPGNGTESKTQSTFSATFSIPNSPNNEVWNVKLVNRTVLDISKVALECDHALDDTLTVLKCFGVTVANWDTYGIETKKYEIPHSSGYLEGHKNQEKDTLGRTYMFVPLLKRDKADTRLSIDWELIRSEVDGRATKLLHTPFCVYRGLPFFILFSVYIAAILFAVGMSLSSLMSHRVDSCTLLFDVFILAFVGTPTVWFPDVLDSRDVSLASFLLAVAFAPSSCLTANLSRCIASPSTLAIPIILSGISLLVALLPFLPPKQIISLDSIVNRFILHRHDLYVTSAACESNLNANSSFPKRGPGDKKDKGENLPTYSTFWHYYYNKYGKEIRYPRLPLITALKVEKHSEFNFQCVQLHEGQKVHLIQEFMSILPIPRDFIFVMGIVDLFMRSLERQINIKQLSNTIDICQDGEQNHASPQNASLPSLLNAATTLYPQKGYERLEFLGDGVLGFYVSINIIAGNSSLSLSLDQLSDKIQIAVTNKVLAPAALRVGLPRLLLACKQKWHSAYRQAKSSQLVLGTANISDGTLSDVFESFVAAVFLSGRQGDDSSRVLLKILDKASLPLPHTEIISKSYWYDSPGIFLKSGYPFQVDPDWSDQLLRIGELISHHDNMIHRLEECTKILFEKLQVPRNIADRLISEANWKTLLFCGLFDASSDSNNNLVTLMRDSLYHVGVSALELSLAIEVFQRFPTGSPTDLHLIKSTCYADDVIAYIMVKNMLHQSLFSKKSYNDLKQEIVQADIKGRSMWKEHSGWVLGLAEFVRRSKVGGKPRYPGIGGGRIYGLETKLDQVFELEMDESYTKHLMFSFKAIFGAFVMSIGLDEAWSCFESIFDELLLLSPDEVRQIYQSSSMVRSY